MDADSLRDGIFALNTRRFGSVAEVLIARMAPAQENAVDVRSAAAECLAVSAIPVAADSPLRQAPSGHFSVETVDATSTEQPFAAVGFTLRSGNPSAKKKRLRGANP